VTDEPFEHVDFSARDFWWVPLFTGVLWILFAVILFRFDYTSVMALSILLGCVCLAGAFFEVVDTLASHGWWRVCHLVLALLFTVIGIVAFTKPGGTVQALAAVFAFYILLRGVFDLISALVVRGEYWWLQLLAGIAQILLAFWAAGDFGHKAILLVIWIGGGALIRGILLIVTAFSVRSQPAPAAT
jgi:uncharacterized membrane protein HdeD (DUF308 family)